ncbi:MAG: hypothetical protein HQ485_02960 [Acidobacteria bacterium]|nr:hypothetical protein [Acidobacteriota bacterium]
MSDNLTADRLLQLAATTHLHASSMRRGGLFGWWRERHFSSAIDQFADSMRALPQAEAETTPDDMIRRIGEMVDAIVEDVEQLIESRRSTPLKRVERDRFLVRRIYDLRESFEKISQRTAPRSGLSDLRRRVESDQP